MTVLKYKPKLLYFLGKSPRCPLHRRLDESQCRASSDDKGKNLIRSGEKADVRVQQ
jgi:hypothetical protein